MEKIITAGDFKIILTAMMLLIGISIIAWVVLRSSANMSDAYNDWKVQR